MRGEPSLWFRALSEHEVAIRPGFLLKRKSTMTAHLPGHSSGNSDPRGINVKKESCIFPKKLMENKIWGHSEGVNRGKPR